MSIKARHIRKSARHKKYHHMLWTLKQRYKDYPEIPLRQLKTVAWMLTATAKEWRRFTFQPLLVKIRPIFVGLTEY